MAKGTFRHSLQTYNQTALATLCGTDTWNEIEHWSNTFKEWLPTFLTLKNGIPSHDTFNRVFQCIDPKDA
ncbi:transposase family protein [bacterium D16-51]|nr:transposase family protein [bacterium D16-59]RKI59955.1 transposase family protein [bacterium D16-51]